MFDVIRAVCPLFLGAPDDALRPLIDYLDSRLAVAATLAHIEVGAECYAATSFGATHRVGDVVPLRVYGDPTTGFYGRGRVLRLMDGGVVVSRID